MYGLQPPLGPHSRVEQPLLLWAASPAFWAHWRYAQHTNDRGVHCKIAYKSSVPLEESPCSAAVHGGFQRLQTKWDMLQLPGQAFLQGNRQKSNNFGEKSLYFCAVASSGRNQPQPSKAFTQHSSCLCDPSYFILLHSLLPGAHRRVPCPSPYYPLSITGELFLLGEEH